MKPRVLKLYVIFVALFLIAPTSFADSIEDEMATAYAGFIRDLVGTTQISKNGTICVFGSDEISKMLLHQSSKYINLDLSPDKYTSCKAIYIAQGMEKGLRSEVDKFNQDKIMTIAIFEGFIESGGMVQVQLGRRNFELLLNSKDIKSSGIRLSALALSLVIN